MAKFVFVWFVLNDAFMIDLYQGTPVPRRLLLRRILVSHGQIVSSPNVNSASDYSYLAQILPQFDFSDYFSLFILFALLDRARGHLALWGFLKCLDLAHEHNTTQWLRRAELTTWRPGPLVTMHAGHHASRISKLTAVKVVRFCVLQEGGWRGGGGGGGFKLVFLMTWWFYHCK